MLSKEDYINLIISNVNMVCPFCRRPIPITQCFESIEKCIKQHKIESESFKRLFQKEVPKTEENIREKDRFKKYMTNIKSLLKELMDIQAN